MGNSISGPTATRAGGAFDSFVSELGSDIVYDKSLGASRFLKTVKCNHRNGPLVVKVFIKSDPGQLLRTYHRRLKAERESLSDIPNVYGYQVFQETERAGYIVRQWLEGSLYDRISTRPFLSLIEKKWIAFQLLNGMRDVRRRNVSHGDIKTENILITSWNWAYLTDFASYKPTFLPLDDPAEFSYFYDTSGRRTCYIAPERFYAPGSEISKKKETLDSDKRDGKVTEAMDVFSMGCVIAELFLDGPVMFTLSQLFKYRAGDFNLEGHLSGIEDEHIRELILSMIALDPAQRPTFDTALHKSRDSVFPEPFYAFLHNYVSSLNSLSSPSVFPRPVHTTAEGGHGVAESASLPSDSDHRLERIWSEFESIEPYLLAVSPVEDTLTTANVPPGSLSQKIEAIFPVELFIPHRASKIQSTLTNGQRAAAEGNVDQPRHHVAHACADGSALIILSLVCANLRNCKLPSSKVHALDVLLALAPHLTDEAKLDRLVPYVMELLRQDDAAIVKCSALRTLMQVLLLVTAITPSNASIFPEYILPNIRDVAKDPDVSVRCVYAQCIAPLADTCLRYLEMGQAMKAHGTFKLTNAQETDDALYEISYEAALQDLQKSIQEQLVMLLVDPSSIVKRATLHNVSSLCIFLGRQRTNDVLLGHMITYLNDRDWQLRHAFFESIVDVAACVGGRSLEEYIYPLMVQALSDVEETVVARVLAAITSLSELGLFQKMRIWELMSATLGFLYHPNIWIREGSSAFIASATKHLPATDVWCILYPSLKHFLRSDIRSIDEQTLLMFLKTPLNRQVFDTAVAWAMKANKTYFWKNPSSKTHIESAKEGFTEARKSGNSPRNNMARTEEDEAQLAKLQQLGMTRADENKLLALREYMLKLSNAISSFPSRIRNSDSENFAQTTNTVELQKLGVVLQTVFVGARPSESSSRITTVSRRSTLEGLGHRSPFHGSPRLSSMDQTAPFDDLRRRLAVINGSSSSLANLTERERSTLVSSTRSTSLASPIGPDAPSIADHRPSSPSDSVVSSNVDGSSLRPRALLHVGSTDNQKAPAAVGSVKTNVTGLLETPLVPRLEDDDTHTSGRSSPISNAGTVRAEHRSSLHSIRPYSLTQDTREPGINNLLDQLYHDSAREAMHDFGPKAHHGPVRRRNSPRQRTFSSHRSDRRAEVALIATLTAHTGSVNGIAVAPDHVFFVTCSDDGTARVWDTARLERNVTGRPRATHTQHHSRVTAICAIEGTHCFASAGEDGSVHIVRVHVTLSGSLPKYGKLHVVREHRVAQPGEYVTCLTHYNIDSGSNLVYATTHATIVVLDVRTMRVLHTMKNPQHQGPIVTLCIDRRHSWLLAGTITGVLTLWDLRFGLQIRSWRAGISVPGSSQRIHACVVHPTRGRGRWVAVSLEVRGSVLIEVWDVERASLVETFESREVPPEATTLHPGPPRVGEEAEKSAANAIAALVRARTASSGTTPRGQGAELNNGESPRSSAAWTQPDVWAMVAGTDFGGHAGVPRLEFTGSGTGLEENHTGGRGFILSGSEDRKICLWDLGKMERSVILSGGDEDGERPTFKTFRAAGSETASHVEMTRHRSTNQGNQNQRAASRTSLIAHHQQNLLKAHQDCITSLACIDSPFRGGIVSGDRAGVIKVWRMEEP